MCRKSSPIPPNAHGHPTWTACFLSFITLMMTLAYCDARASDVSSTRLITNPQESPESKPSSPSDDWQEIYIGRSGDPWAAIPLEQQSSIHPRIPPVNFTYNNSDDLQMRRQESDRHSRSKRGVVHLYNMVVCATGCNPLAYKGYGCYCGFLGSGYVIDGIDRCCKMHDWCYDATDCAMFSEYFVPYYWKCYQGYKPICAVEHGDWGGSGSCSQRLCECDRSLAECLRRFPCPTTKAMCTSSPWRLVQNLFMVM